MVNSSRGRRARSLYKERFGMIARNSSKKSDAKNADDIFWHISSAFLKF